MARLMAVYNPVLQAAGYQQQGATKLTKTPVLRSGSSTGRGGGQSLVSPSYLKERGIASGDLQVDKQGNVVEVSQGGKQARVVGKAVYKFDPASKSMVLTIVSQSEATTGAYKLAGAEVQGTWKFDAKLNQGQGGYSYAPSMVSTPVSGLASAEVKDKAPPVVVEKIASAARVVYVKAGEAIAGLRGGSVASGATQTKGGVTYVGTNDVSKLSTAQQLGASKTGMQASFAPPKVGDTQVEPMTGITKLFTAERGWIKVNPTVKTSTDAFGNVMISETVKGKTNVWQQVPQKIIGSSTLVTTEKTSGIVESISVDSFMPTIAPFTSSRYASPTAQDKALRNAAIKHVQELRTAGYSGVYYTVKGGQITFHGKATAPEGSMFTQTGTQSQSFFAPDFSRLERKQAYENFYGMLNPKVEVKPERQVNQQTRIEPLLQTESDFFGAEKRASELSTINLLEFNQTKRVERANEISKEANRLSFSSVVSSPEQREFEQSQAGKQELLLTQSFDPKNNLNPLVPMLASRSPSIFGNVYSGAMAVPTLAGMVAIGVSEANPLRSIGTSTPLKLTAPSNPRYLFSLPSRIAGGSVEFYKEKISKGVVGWAELGAFTYGGKLFSIAPSTIKFTKLQALVPGEPIKPVYVGLTWNALGRSGQLVGRTASGIAFGATELRLPKGATKLVTAAHVFDIQPFERYAENVRPGEVAAFKNIKTSFPTFDLGKMVAGSKTLADIAKPKEVFPEMVSGELTGKKVKFTPYDISRQQVGAAWIGQAAPNIGSRFMASAFELNPEAFAHLPSGKTIITNVVKGLSKEKLVAKVGGSTSAFLQMVLPEGQETVLAPNKIPVVKTIKVRAATPIEWLQARKAADVDVRLNLLEAEIGKRVTPRFFDPLQKAGYKVTKRGVNVDVELPSGKQEHGIELKSVFEDETGKEYGKTYDIGFGFQSGKPTILDKVNLEPLAEQLQSKTAITIARPEHKGQVKSLIDVYRQGQFIKRSIEVSPHLRITKANQLAELNKWLPLYERALKGFTKEQIAEIGKQSEPTTLSITKEKGIGSKILSGGFRETKNYALFTSTKQLDVGVSYYNAVGKSSKALTPLLYSFKESKQEGYKQGSYRAATGKPEIGYVQPAYKTARRVKYIGYAIPSKSTGYALSGYPAYNKAKGYSQLSKPNVASYQLMPSASKQQTRTYNTPAPSGYAFKPTLPSYSYPPSVPQPPHPPKPPFRFVKGAGGDLTLKKRKKKKAYSVLVKRKGKWQVLKKNLPKGYAVQAGEQYSLKTLGASFKVEASGETEREDIAYSPNLNVFRTFKIKHGQRIPLKDEFIQRRGKRLASFTERAEIRRAKNERKQWGFNL